MAPTRSEVLAVVERSPACVGAHDRESWLDLFCDEAVVEDPVGSAPATKAGGVLGRFWDTFIAPHGIRFEVRRDCVAGKDVFRDAVIHTRVRAGVEVQVPAYLLYQLCKRGDRIYVSRMAAHWTLARMVGVALRLGPRGWWAMTSLFLRMIRIMGLGWVSAYLSSLWRTVGRDGLSSAEALARSVEMRSASALTALFVAPDASVELGERTVTAASLLDEWPPGTRVSVEQPVCAGWTAAFRFSLDGPSPAEGLALLEFDPLSSRIRRARFFPA